MTQAEETGDRRLEPRSDMRGGSDYQDLRLALAMSGGVSLAIWMGGVAMEVYRVVRQDPLRASGTSQSDEVAAEVYGKLLELTRSTPRVDVIAGASAGGLNGALLAVAMVHGSDLSILKDLWLEQASLDKLFRPPFAQDPPSLLQGDDYFLPELRKAFARLKQGSPKPPEEVPIWLMMTTTLLNANRRGIADALGSLLPDVVHQGLFEFRRGAGEGDDFNLPDIVDRLALASRSTASFPGAFEASFVPVGASTTKPSRPNMKESVDFPTSRFVVDGGVLVNKPIRPALRAIFAQPAGDKPVRRVFAYIVPDPGVVAQNSADDPEAIPSLGSVVMQSLVTIPRAESISAELQELAEHNRRARGQQILRQQMLEQSTDGEGLRPTAERLFEPYRRLRAERIVDTALEKVDPFEARDAGLAEEAVRVLRWLVQDGETPWLPTGKTRAEADQRSAWPWGVGAAESAGTVALDLIRRALNLCLLRLTALDGFREALGVAREQLHQALARVSILRDLEDTYLSGEVTGLLADRRTAPGGEAAPEIQDWLRDWMRGREPFDQWVARQPGAPAPGEVAREIAAILVEAAPVIQSAAAVAGNEGITEPQAKAWDSVTADVARAVPDGSVPRTEQLLVDLAIVQFTLAGGMPVLEQQVDFVQISANTPNGLDDRATVDRKVAGIQLGHFGAFYKRSWRANDWMWGRLDGAMRLVQVLLNPARFRERALEERRPDGPVAWGLAEVKALAVPREEDDARSHEILNRLWARDEDNAENELRYLGEPERAAPGSLPICAGAIARRVQLDILQVELLGVATAIESDGDDRAAVSTQARDFLRKVRATGATDRLAPSDAARLFGLCRVGEERIADEMGSDLFTSTASRAAAVGVSAAAGARSGLGPLQYLLRTLRNVVLTLYVLARSAVAKGRSGFAFATILLALGGALVAVGVAEQLILETVPMAVGSEARPGFPSGFLDRAGIVLLVAGLVLMLLRAGLAIGLAYVGAALVVALGPYIWVDVAFKGDDGWQGWMYANRFAIPVVALVVSSVLAGWVRRNWGWKVFAWVLLLVVVVGVAILAVLEHRAPPLWLAILTPVAALAVGFALAWFLRGKKQVRSRLPG